MDNHAVRNESKSRYESTTLLKAFSIINFLADARSPQPLLEVCSCTNLNKTTAFRLLHAMEDQGYVSRSIGGYSLGYRLSRVAQSVSNTGVIRRIARPILENVASMYGATVYLGFEQDHDVQVADRISGRTGSPPPIHIGTKLPFHATALGKVLIAAGNENDWQRITPGHSLPTYTERTVVDRGRLLNDLIAVRGNGFAVSSGEYLSDLECIAVSMKDEEGVPICGLALSFSEKIGAEAIQDRASKLIESAEQIRDLLRIK